MVSSALVHREIEEIRSYLAPHKLGVGTRYGTETIKHAARAIVSQYGFDPEMGLLQLDFENAFNIVSRSSYRRELYRKFPSMAPWVRYCYGRDNQPELWSRYFEFRSLNGLHQGDLMGPLLFALALQPILLKLREKLVQTRATHNSYRYSLLLAFYLDDGIIIGNHKVLAAAYRFLQSDMCKKHSLRLKQSGTKAWWPTLASTTDKSKPMTSNWNTSNAVKDLYPHGTRFHTGPVMVFVGTPIGSSDLMQKVMTF